MVISMEKPGVKVIASIQNTEGKWSPRIEVLFNDESKILTWPTRVFDTKEAADADAQSNGVLNTKQKLSQGVLIQDL